MRSYQVYYIVGKERRATLNREEKGRGRSKVGEGSRVEYRRLEI